MSGGPEHSLTVTSKMQGPWGLFVALNFPLFHLPVDSIPVMAALIYLKWPGAGWKGDAGSTWIQEGWILQNGEASKFY